MNPGALDTVWVTIHSLGNQKNKLAAVQNQMIVCHDCLMNSNFYSKFNNC